ncbi:MAG: hypothetical protein PHI63_05735, partial [Patescibacteria group bacterium]|nr:hypothetical protein [Patescibacteria group bacterium]
AAARQHAEVPGEEAQAKEAAERSRQAGVIRNQLQSVQEQRAVERAPAQAEAELNGARLRQNQLHAEAVPKLNALQQQRGGLEKQRAQVDERKKSYEQQIQKAELAGDKSARDKAVTGRDAEGAKLAALDKSIASVDAEAKKWKDKEAQAAQEVVQREVTLKQTNTAKARGVTPPSVAAAGGQAAPGAPAVETVEGAADAVQEQAQAMQAVPMQQVGAALDKFTEVAHQMSSEISSLVDHEQQMKGPGARPDAEGEKAKKHFKDLESVLDEARGQQEGGQMTDQMAQQYRLRVVDLLYRINRALLETKRRGGGPTVIQMPRPDTESASPEAPRVMPAAASTAPGQAPLPPPPGPADQSGADRNSPPKA